MSKIGRITPTGVITEFAVPTPNSLPKFITAGPDGNLWFGEVYGNQIGRITPAGVFSEFPLPNEQSYPSAIAAGPDATLWFVEATGLGRITTAGIIAESPPKAGTDLKDVAIGPGRKLWATDRGTDSIAVYHIP